MFKRIIIFSITIITLAWVVYWFNFSYINSYKISNNPGDWGVLGDFLGGVLNPILTFLTIVLLINSLGLQKESNDSLKSEIQRNELLERKRTFESRFFNMIDSQKTNFDSFKLDFINAGVIETKLSASAVLELENLIIDITAARGSKKQIKQAIEMLDDYDEIYTVIRIFCVIAKTINEKLSNENGFSFNDRLDFYETLINFTDYSLFKLILICIKYLEFPNLDILRRPEFTEALKNVGAAEYLDNI